MCLPRDKEEHQGKGGWTEVVPQEEEQLVLQGRNKGNKHEALAKDFGECWDQATCQLCVLWQMV